MIVAVQTFAAHQRINLEWPDCGSPQKESLLSKRKQLNTCLELIQDFYHRE